MSRLALLLLAAVLTPAAYAADISINDLLSDDDFGAVALSPDGKLLAATVPAGDRTVLAIISVADSKVVSGYQPGKNSHVMEMHWASSERLVYALGEKIGALKAPQSYGELFAVNADGKQVKMLIGQRAPSDTAGSSRVRTVKAERVFAELIDPMIDDPRSVLISVSPIDEAPYSKVDLLDVGTGRRKTIARAPVQRASFVLDHKNEVRFAHGRDPENYSQLYYRKDRDSEWVLINDERVSQRTIVPVGFAADDKSAYLIANEAEGPDALYRFDAATLEQTRLLSNPNTDPHQLMFSPFDDALFAVVFMDGKPKVEYIDPENPASRLHRSLQASFPGQLVSFGPATADRKMNLLMVRSDRNSGDVYLFNHESKRASYLMAINRRIDPDQMVEMQPIQLLARDGTPLHGYLSKPRGSDGNQKHPLVLMPHGGPIGVRDSWGFDPTVQALASRGYAVLQVNYRGSSGYGREFELAGHRQWGKAMQDDLTDATRWAVSEGITEGDSVCIYGSSYGAYAALMGAATQPDLYRCAAGEFGVYELPLMFKSGEIADLRWGQAWLADILGKDDLVSISPTRLADRIKIPVLLTAGTQDERAPERHTELMYQALRQHGAQVEAKFYPGEGHGFHEPGNRVDSTNRLLAFLDKHLKQTPVAAPAAGD